jgi:hypothetical protein
MLPVERYLAELALMRRAGAGVDELSGYPALKTLLDEVGSTTKPKVRAIMHLRNLGAGLPDGGLFTATQFKGKTATQPRDPSRPDVAAIEVKGTAADINAVIASEQVNGYLTRYGQVLVTNYRQFVLMVERDGSARKADEFSLADTDAAFWSDVAGRPRAWATERGERFHEFLTRVLRSRARLTEPSDVAWMLASHARDAMEILGERKLRALETIRTSFEEALGITFEGEQGDHFFRSSLVQTLFYGIFSGWVLWSRQTRSPDAVFDWKDAGWTLHVPMISALFDQIATRKVLGNLELIPVLERTGEVLNRVDRVTFFQKFQEQEAVQYFYEPFLQAFDPELRKQLGVWYTPREVVQYMVARVDTVLREELNLPRGLADPNVVVLDPCCGTGAYLVEVLRNIETTLREEGGDALVASDLRKAAIERIFGFEILPAPFVVAHLQLGLLLQQLGAPLPDNSDARVGVFLTNALTGWDPDAKHPDLPFRELAEERDRAGAVKQAKPILVILGNPPYNGYAGVTASAEERALSNEYRKTKRAPAPQGQGLNDLYVRFFRMAERKIVEQTGRGIVCFISNYSWLDGLSFTGMRERYLEVYDRIWIDCLNGDKYRTGKLTPEGEPDPSIFSTPSNREGIQVGTAVALLARTPAAEGGATLFYRDFWGRGKLSELALESRTLAKEYSQVRPTPSIGLAYRTIATGDGYDLWPSLVQLFSQYFPGVQTKRDDFLVDIDRDALLSRLATYFSPGVADHELRALHPEIMKDTARYDPLATRQRLLGRGLLAANVVRYLYRPFDIRWVYWEPEGKLLGEKSPGYFPHAKAGNVWLEARQKQPKEVYDRGICTTVLADNLGNGFSTFFPLYLSEGASSGALFDAQGWKENLAPRAATFVHNHHAKASDLFDHALAIIHSPAYRLVNAGALRQDWSHIPLPASQEALERSAALGAELRQLLDPEVPVTDAPVSGYPDRFRGLGALTAADGGQLDPSGGDLAVTAGWGIRGKGGITMPARGRVTDNGESVDVWLNDRAYWGNVPKAVWEYTLGGYQVIKKWLSYREKALLGRDLTEEEARYVTEMVRRIAAIISLGTALDASYEAVKADVWEWGEG